MISEEKQEREAQQLADLVQIVVESVVGVLSDPTTEIKLRKARAVVETARTEQEANSPTHERRATRGTCPECGNSYVIKKNGILRRHGDGPCYMRDLCPAELIPAYLVLSSADERADDDESGSGNNVQ